MSKTIFITGSTDGIGLATAQELLGAGHQVMIHGRNAEKLQDVEKQLRTIAGETQVETYLADLSHMKDVDDLARAVTDNHSRLDVLINNAGVHGGRRDATGNGLDPRFAVNTISPYLLTQRLLPLLGSSGQCDQRFIGQPWQPLMCGH